MQAVVIADRKGLELLPLTTKTCVALLPVAGKPVLEHTLELLVASGIIKIHIVISSFPEQVRAYFGDGTRWGAKLTYSTSRGEEAVENILSRLNPLPQYPLLCLRGDVLRSRLPDLTVLPQQSRVIHLGAQNAFAVIALASESRFWKSLNWLASKDYNETIQAEDRLYCPGQTAYLENLTAYHAVNLDVVGGRFSGLRIPGRQTALGLTQGRRTQVHPRVLKQGVVLIGSQSQLHPSAELNVENVIGDRVIVDRRASIISSVILSDTYIGELVEIRNAIVWGNDLIRVDSSAIVKVTDSFLLADIENNPVKSTLYRIINRLAGVLFLFLSLPLWLLAGLEALKSYPNCLKTVQLRGNRLAIDLVGMTERREFTTWEWNVRPPILRYLPRLFAVITGDLNAVGTRPVTSEEASQRQEDWEKQADMAPAGLIGLAQLTLPLSATVEEKLVADSFYAAQNSGREDWLYIWKGLKALFTRQAWVAE